MSLFEWTRFAIYIIGVWYLFSIGKDSVGTCFIEGYLDRYTLRIISSVQGESVALGRRLLSEPHSVVLVSINRRCVQVSPAFVRVGYQNISESSVIARDEGSLLPCALLVKVKRLESKHAKIWTIAVTCRPNFVKLTILVSFNFALPASNNSEITKHIKWSLQASCCVGCVHEI